MKNPTGLPRICSISKDWNMRTIINIKTSTIGGVIRGNVIRNAVPISEAPDVLPASSRETSMFRKAGVSSMTLWEMALAIRWAKMMPGRLKILKMGSLMKGTHRIKATFTMPTLSSRRNVQPMVTDRVGIMKDIQNPNSRFLL